MGVNEDQRAAWVQRILGSIRPGSRLLDAGTGEQPYKSFYRHLNVVTQDFGAYDGVGDGAGLYPGSWTVPPLDLECDIVGIPEADGSFDAILCTEVLEHVPRPLLVLEEFSRLLRPSGYLIVTAPFCSLTHLAPYHFYSGFTRYFYQMALPANGFDIIEMEANGDYFLYLVQELLRLPSICARYSHDEPSRWERWAIQMVIRMLERFSRKGIASAELLNFGLHVVAVKTC